MNQKINQIKMKQIQQQIRKFSNKKQCYTIPPSGVRGLLLFLLLCLFTYASADEVQQIADKYRTWIVGSDATDYSNPLVKERFRAILDAAQKAHEFYNKYDFSNLEPYDFETKKMPMTK